MKARTASFVSGVAVLLLGSAGVVGALWFIWRK